MPRTKDFYCILRVPVSARRNEIVDAYRRLASISRGMPQVMVDLNRIMLVLTEDSLRAAYDRWRLWKAANPESGKMPGFFKIETYVERDEKVLEEGGWLAIW